MRTIRLLLPVLFVFILPLVAGCDDGATSEKSAEETGTPPQTIVLTCYIGENMVHPMHAIKEAYEKLHPEIRVECYDSGTTTLEKTIRNTRSGDIFLPGSNSYTDKMKEEGLVTWDSPVCKHILAVIVLKDSGINEWEDLLKPSVKIGRGNENVCSVGRLAKKVVERAGLPELEANVEILSVVNFQSSSFRSLVDGRVAALLNWRNMSVCPEDIRDRMKIIDIPEEINIIKTIPVAVLVFSKNPQEANLFARYVAGPEGKRFFRQYGFVTTTD